MPLTVIHTSAMLGALKVWISRYVLVRGGEGEMGRGFVAPTDIIKVCLWGKFSVARCVQFEVIYKYVCLDRKPGL
jgi:hypothetical protein